MLAAALAPALPGVAHASAPRLCLPAPTGRHPIGTASLHLIDRDRLDPLAPDTRPREIMVRLWYPARCHTSTVPYLSATMSGLLIDQFNALAGTDHPRDLLTFPTRGRADAPFAVGSHPLVLLSPALGTNAAFYTALAQELASAGYVVAGIDHTFDAIVEFPGGRIEAPFAEVPFDLLLQVRTADMRLALDRLRAMPGIDRVATAAVGHSMGSMTTIEAMATDRRVLAGVVLDGNPLGSSSLDRPFLMLGNPTHRRATDADWAGFYDRLRGPRLHLVVDGCEHYDLSDIAAFKASIDLDEVFEVGPIDGTRVITITRAYVTAWLGRGLFGRRDPLLEREPRRFPEVDFQPVNHTSRSDPARYSAQNSALADVSHPSYG